MITGGRPRLVVSCESWEMAEPLRISFGVIDRLDVVVAALAGERGHVGRGEGAGVFYLDDTAADGARELEAAARALDTGARYDDVMAALTSYAARCALDCAAWDLRCKQTGKSIWELTGVARGPVATFSTISLDAPERMAASAAARRDARLKLKIDATDPVGQVEAVRAARPDATLIADANQAFDIDQLRDIAPALAALGLEMLEQPLPAGRDEALEGYDSPLLLGADESCFTAHDLDAVAPRYGCVNVKLDKTGGLTEALRLQAEAHKRGLKTMVGCMVGTSLSTAPGMVIALNGASFVDLDGPILLARDRDGGVVYVDGVAEPPPPSFWG